MLLEERLNACQDQMDLMYNASPIADLVIKIEKLVTSCHKLELATGTLLDKQAIVQFGSELVALISEEIADTVVLTRLSDKIADCVARTCSLDPTNAAQETDSILPTA